MSRAALTRNVLNFEERTKLVAYLTPRIPKLSAYPRSHKNAIYTNLATSSTTDLGFPVTNGNVKWVIAKHFNLPIEPAFNKIRTETPTPTYAPSTPDPEVVLNIAHTMATRLDNIATALVCLNKNLESIPDIARAIEALYDAWTKAPVRPTSIPHNSEAT